MQFIKHPFRKFNGMLVDVLLPYKVQPKTEKHQILNSMSGSKEVISQQAKQIGLPIKDDY